MTGLLRMAWAICAQDIQERFGGSLLGSLWIFIWPLVQLFIYIVIFGAMMGARLGANAGPHSYGLYVASGLLAWTCFAPTLQRTVRAFLDRRNVIAKTAVDLRVFPLAICLGELLPFFAGFILLWLVSAILSRPPELSWLLLAIFALYCQQALALGLGLFLGCCAVFARDIVEAAAIALQIGFWFTPIVYPLSILPAWLARCIWLNPMAGIVEVFQECFVFHGLPDCFQIAYFALISHLFLLLGLICLRHWRKDIRDVL